MPVALTIQLNGTQRTFSELRSPADLASIINALELKEDRIAVELNGEIASRTRWEQTRIDEGDRLEIVHFVGGGAN